MQITINQHYVPRFYMKYFAMFFKQTYLQHELHSI